MDTLEALIIEKIRGKDRPGTSRMTRTDNVMIFMVVAYSSWSFCVSKVRPQA
ncbi:MAG: hypothetical protein AB1611_00820 [bacterium]